MTNIIELYHLKSFVRIAKENGVKTILVHHSETGMPAAPDNRFYFFQVGGFLYMFEAGDPSGVSFEGDGLTLASAQVFPLYYLFEERKKQKFEF